MTCLGRIFSDLFRLTDAVRFPLHSAYKGCKIQGSEGCRIRPGKSSRRSADIATVINRFHCARGIVYAVIFLSQISGNGLPTGMETPGGMEFTKEKDIHLKCGRRERD
jgi:hypothetical protein